MRTFTIDFNGDRASMIGDMYEIDGMQFLADHDVQVGQLLDGDPKDIDHPFHLEVVKESKWNPIYMYPLERGCVRELAKRISRERGTRVNVVASARILVCYENGVLTTERNITDFYVMSEEEAKMYQL